MSKHLDEIETEIKRIGYRQASSTDLDAKVALASEAPGLSVKKRTLAWRFRQLSLLFFWLLIHLAISGCSSISEQESFVKSHSLDAFMADRPQAAQLLCQHPALEQWFRAEWQRPIGDYRIVWSDEKPTRSGSAETLVLEEDKLLVIHVSKNHSPVDQLVALGFETCNAQAHSSFESIFALASSGAISRKDFVDKMLENEHNTVIRMKESFLKLLPYSMNKLGTNSLYRALSEIPVGFREAQSWSLTNSQNYIHAIEVYGQQFDELQTEKK